MEAEELERLAELVAAKLQRLTQDHPLGPQLQYSRKQAANLLAVSLSTLRLLIDRGDIRVRRWGSAVFITHEELLRLVKRGDIATLWPEKPEGKKKQEIA